MKYVAWIDILGSRSLMKKDDDRAKHSWKELRELVKKYLPPKGEAEIYGINDGFYAISENPALIQGLVRVYQSWFDKFSEEKGSRPLLRGAISTSLAETVQEDDSNVCMWLEGPAFRDAFHDEQLLRGCRLFINHTAITAAENQAQVPCYEWQGLSAYELKEDKPLGEILWPISEDSADLLVKAEKSLKLYEAVFDDFLRKEANSGPKDPPSALLQYEETLKLMLRSIGRKLRAGGGRKEELEQFVSDLLKYRPDQFRFTWGITFVALEAVFLADCLDGQHYVQSVKEYLMEQRHHSVNQPYVKDFEKELNLLTYKHFSEWFHSI